MTRPSLLLGSDTLGWTDLGPVIGDGSLEIEP
jgi:hypothetical protein